MTDVEPFAVLGLDPDATLEEVRAARRRLAFELHPDRSGGEPTAARRMREVNVAFDLAVKAILRRAEPSRVTTPAPPPVRRVARLWTDVASFMIDGPVPDAFERLFVVSHWVGEPLHADPPDVLEVHLLEPTPCFCRLDLMPEGAATMVSVTVGTLEPWETSAPPTDVVRDLFVALVNQLSAQDEYRDRTDE